MKKIIFVLLIITLIFSLSACNRKGSRFGIYLVKNGLKDIDKDLNDLELEEKPILDSDDILRYFWDTQAFITKKDFLSDKLRDKINVYGIPYVVVADGERIYLGKFNTAISSVYLDCPFIIFDGIQYLLDNKKFKLTNEEQIYFIEWNKNIKEVTDKVLDKRIHKALKNDGILKK